MASMDAVISGMNVLTAYNGSNGNGTTQKTKKN
jgi:hypothetical protein